MDSILEECHAPCKLNISYVDFEKELGASFPLRKTSFSSLSNTLFVSVASNVVGPFTHPSLISM